MCYVDDPTSSLQNDLAKGYDEIFKCLLSPGNDKLSAITSGFQLPVRHMQSVIKDFFNYDWDMSQTPLYSCYKIAAANHRYLHGNDSIFILMEIVLMHHNDLISNITFILRDDFRVAINWARAIIAARNFVQNPNDKFIYLNRNANTIIYIVLHPAEDYVEITKILVE